jgi:hypothetical protein
MAEGIMVTGKGLFHLDVKTASVFHMLAEDPGVLVNEGLRPLIRAQPDILVSLG